MRGSRQIRGLRAIVGHELTSGWGVIGGACGLLLLIAWRLHGSPLRLTEPTLLVTLLALPALMAAPIGARRLLAEGRAGWFLTTRPVSRLTIVTAKGLATAVDVLLLVGAAVLLELAAREVLLLNVLIHLPPLVGWVPLVGVVIVGALSFGCFAAFRSRWIAGATCGAGMVLGAGALMMLASRQAGPESLVPTAALVAVLIALPIVPLIAALWRGEVGGEVA